MLQMMLLASASALRTASTQMLANDEAALEAYIETLISDMTNEEKARQLDMYSGRDLLKDGKPDEGRANQTLGGLGIGRIHDFYAQDPKVANAMQRMIVMNSRHGIPALVGEEGVHGYQGDGHTVCSSASKLLLHLACIAEVDICFLLLCLHLQMSHPYHLCCVGISLSNFYRRLVQFHTGIRDRPRHWPRGAIDWNT